MSEVELWLHDFLVEEVVENGLDEFHVRGICDSAAIVDLGHQGIEVRITDFLLLLQMHLLYL